MIIERKKLLKNNKDLDVKEINKEINKEIKNMVCITNIIIRIIIMPVLEDQDFL